MNDFPGKDSTCKEKNYLFTLCYWIRIIMIPLTLMMVGFSDRVVIM